VIKELLSNIAAAQHVSASEARQTISGWKNARVGVTQAQSQAGNSRQTLLVGLYAEYERILRRNNAFDFDDLVARPVQLFEEEPEVLQNYASRFLHVLVDEFQDTNALQMDFIGLLARVHGNLFVVGDDDQSIYSWRGARIANILEFESQFTGSQVVRLEQNYRSTTPILQAANHLIAHNRGRKGKNLWTARQGGELLRVSFHADEEDEAAHVVDVVRGHVTAGGARADVAVLYRTNAQSRALEDALRRAGIPYQIIGGTRFYERREVRDVVAYLKAIQNPADSIALVRILNVPRRGIGDTTIERLQVAAAERGETLAAALAAPAAAGLGTAPARKVSEFARLLSELRHLAEKSTCADVVQAVLEATNYFDYLRDSEPATYQARRENVEELVSAARTFADESTDDPSLRAFLEEISLLTDVDTMAGNVDQVTMMTLHSAKGLEFPLVLLTGLEEGLLPHANSLDAIDTLEEERRLFYVGLTRARDRLFLLSASNRRRFGDYQSMMQSRFLGELPEAVVEVDAPRATPARRPAWSSQQPSWRSYGEGDPDTYWRKAGLAPEPSRRVVRSEAEDSQEAAHLEVGMRVQHERFGVGHVQRIEGQGDMMKVTVVFGRNESRKFVARYAHLTPVR
jgi:DNA helicase-2/ATP-dependent DNA helicase PcrA